MIPDIVFSFPGMKVTRFSINKGDKIPLHGHPNQRGLVLVLEGKCSIKKYKILSRNNIAFKIQMTDMCVLSKNGYSVITPVDNIHELVADEDTVFLDIFSPGVVDGMLSEYLKILTVDSIGDFLVVEPIDINEVDMAEYLKLRVTHKVIVE